MASAQTATALVVTDKSASEIITAAGYTRAQVDLIKSTVAVGATDMELALFLQICQHRGLDPTAKQIYFIKRKQKRQDPVTGQWGEEMVGTIQTAIDGFRLLADRSGKSDGQDEPEFLVGPGGELIKATVRVYRKDVSRPYVGVAYWSEYAQPTAPMWSKMPHTMLAKCAEALALRKAYPENLSGMYVAEEMGAQTTLDGEVVHGPDGKPPTGKVTQIRSVPSVDESERAHDDFSAANAATTGPASDGIPPANATLPALRLWLGERCGFSGASWTKAHMETAIAEVTKVLGLGEGVVTPRTLSAHLLAYRDAIAAAAAPQRTPDGPQGGGVPPQVRPQVNPTPEPATAPTSAETGIAEDPAAVTTAISYVTKKLAELGLADDDEVCQEIAAAVSAEMDDAVAYGWRLLSTQAMMEFSRRVVARVTDVEP